MPPASYDLVYSSLAFHYVEGFDTLLAAIRHGLTPGGKLVFSIEHPIFMAPRQPGWLTDAQGRKTWPVDSYQLQGPRMSDWLAPGVIKQHRTLGTTLSALLHAGFQLEHVAEWGPLTNRWRNSRPWQKSASGRCCCWWGVASSNRAVS